MDSITWSEALLLERVYQQPLSRTQIAFGRTGTLGLRIESYHPALDLSSPGWQTPKFCAAHAKRKSSATSCSGWCSCPSSRVFDSELTAVRSGGAPLTKVSSKSLLLLRGVDVRVPFGPRSGRKEAHAWTCRSFKDSWSLIFSSSPSEPLEPRPPPPFSYCFCSSQAARKT